MTNLHRGGHGCRVRGGAVRARTRGRAVASWTRPGTPRRTCRGPGRRGCGRGRCAGWVWGTTWAPVACGVASSYVGVSPGSVGASGRRGAPGKWGHTVTLSPGCRGCDCLDSQVGLLGLVGGPTGVLEGLAGHAPQARPWGPSLPGAVVGGGAGADGEGRVVQEGRKGGCGWVWPVRWVVLRRQEDLLVSEGRPCGCGRLGVLWAVWSGRVVEGRVGDGRCRWPAPPPNP